MTIPATSDRSYQGLRAETKALTTSTNATMTTRDPDIQDSARALRVMAHGKWQQAGVPHRGWLCVGEEDLDDVRETCEMCEHQEIRYVQLMTHTEYPDVLRVGCDCAGYMSGHLLAAEDRDREMRNRANRLRTWRRRVWSSLAGRDGQVTFLQGMRVRIYRVEGGWGGDVYDKWKSKERISRIIHPTISATKAAAFLVVDRIQQWRRR
jgi:hypothetical protein